MVVERVALVVIIGRIAMPSLIAQAASPPIGAVLMDWLGADGTLLALVVAVITDVLLVGLTFALMQRRRGPSAMVVGSAEQRTHTRSETS